MRRRAHLRLMVLSPDIEAHDGYHLKAAAHVVVGASDELHAGTQGTALAHFAAAAGGDECCWETGTAFSFPPPSVVTSAPPAADFAPPTSGVAPTPTLSHNDNVDSLSAAAPSFSVLAALVSSALAAPVCCLIVRQ